MRVRSFIVWTLVVCLTGTGLLWLSPGSPEGQAGSVQPAALERPQHAEKRAPTERVKKPTADASPPLPEDPVKKRAEKVQAALEAFEARTASITPDQARASLDRVAVAKKALEARPTPTPKVEPHEDEHGVKWQRLTYENGEMLYVLAPE